MSAIPTSYDLKMTMPEEVTSYRNIQSSFPGIYSSGKDLLADLAAKIQLMRLETEMFSQLQVESNKEEITSHEKSFKDVAENVAKFRETLESVNGQLERAISLCSEVPLKDVRSFADSDKTTVKVYDFCQKIIPELRDWHTQGSMLNKRFSLLLDYDRKNYTESITNFTQVVHPSSWSLGSIASSFSSYLFSQPQVSEVKVDDKVAAAPTLTAAVSSPEEKKK